MKVKLLEPIEGFEDVAQYRVPNPGECYINAINGHVENAIKGSDLKRIVLTPIKRWRPATIDDAVMAIKGETVVARGKDAEHHEWATAEPMTGYDSNAKAKWILQTYAWAFCEVLDA